MTNLMDSPVKVGFCTVIEKSLQCLHCLKTKMKSEENLMVNFMQLRKQDKKDIEYGRKIFATNGIEDGLLYEPAAKSKLSFLNIFKKKNEDNCKPVLSLRDYLCNLNCSINGDDR